MLGRNDSAQLLIEPISGWRAWRVIDGKLASPDKRCPWYDGQLMWDMQCHCGYQRRQQALKTSESRGQAVAKRQGRADDECLCGINAFAEREQLANSSYVDHDAIGHVHLTGQVRGYAIGWRAERARIVEVWATSQLTAGKVQAAAEASRVTYRGVAGRDFVEWDLLQARHLQLHRHLMKLTMAVWLLIALAGALATWSAMATDRGLWPAAVGLVLIAALYTQVAAVRVVAQGGYVSRHHLPEIASSRMRWIYTACFTCVLIGTFSPLLFVIAVAA